MRLLLKSLGVENSIVSSILRAVTSVHAIAEEHDVTEEDPSSVADADFL